MDCTILDLKLSERTVAYYRFKSAIQTRKVQIESLLNVNDLFFAFYQIIIPPPPPMALLFDGSSEYVMHV